MKCDDAHVEAAYTSALPTSGLGELATRFFFSLGVAFIVFLLFALITVAINGQISINIGPMRLYANDASDSELRDRLLYLPFYLIGPLVVFAVNCRVPVEQMAPPRNAIVLFPAIVLTHLGLSLSGKLWPLFFLALAFAATLGSLHWQRGRLSAPAPVMLRTVGRVSILDAIALMAICTLIFPASPSRVAAHIGANIAKISYFVGPALYGYGTNLVPGLDYYSHYGVGLGPVFWLLQGTGWKAAAVHGVEFTLVVTVLFYCAVYVLLVFLTGSRAIAFAVPAFLAILNFSTYFPFDAPSAYPVRYVFLIPFVIAYAWLCGTQRWLAPLAAMGCFAGLSLFWHTEVGLYVIIAGAGGVVLAFGFGRAEFAKIGIFALLTLASFFAASFAFVGPRALSLSFFVAALQPITAYAVGWDGVPIKWNTVWSIFYNIPFQLTAVVTIGCFWSLRRRREDLSLRERRVSAVLVMLSLIGLGMLTKWINLSYDAEWHQNIAPLLIVMSWWIHFLWGNTGARPAFVRLGIAARVALAGALTAAAAAVLLLVQDRANPYPYGLRSYAYYPSLVKAAVAPWQLYDRFTYSDHYFLNLNTTWDWPDILATISKDDIDLIQKNVSPHQRALVISVADWAYLAEAERPPRAFFVPLLWAFDNSFINRSFEGADIVFVDKRFETRTDLPAMRLLINRINRDYVPAEHATTLTLYRSKASLWSPSASKSSN